LKDDGRPIAMSTARDSHGWRLSGGTLDFATQSLDIRANPFTTGELP
jgi:hypothetical protein